MLNPTVFNTLGFATVAIKAMAFGPYRGSPYPSAILGESNSLCLVAPIITGLRLSHIVIRPMSNITSASVIPAASIGISMPRAFFLEVSGAAIFCAEAMVAVTQGTDYA